MRKTKPHKRFWWLVGQILSNHFKVGAEIGVANGTTTKKILQYCPEVFLFAVDRWENVEKPDDLGDRLEDENYVGMYNWDAEAGFRKFSNNIRPYKSRVQVLKGDSVEMADQVKDGSLDFIFIDADHSYQGVIRDLAAWVPKLRVGGMLSGHDIHLAGVHRAVSEKIPNYQEVPGDHVWKAVKEDYED